MSLIKAALLGQQGVDTGKEIVSSGAFASEDSAYLSRTFTSSATWSFSVWVKRASLDAVMGILEGSVSFNSNNTINLHSYVSTEVFRDTGGWYHFFVSNNGAYVNGQLLGSATTTALTDPDIGRTGTLYFDGYLTEIHFTDGTAYTADDFGYTNEIGVWVPKSPSVTYGTNGFYLPFTGTMGHDESGNSNDFTNNNVTQSSDTPTYNHAIINSLLPGTYTSITDAGLGITTPIAFAPQSMVTEAVSSGKWYFEFKPTVNGVLSYSGIRSTDGSKSVVYFASSGDKYLDGVNTTYGATYTTNDVIGVAFDIDNDTVEFFKNNVSQGSISYTFDTSLEYAPFVHDANNTQALTCLMYMSEADWTYAAPSGFLPLVSTNLPDSEINDGSKFFNTVLYTGNAPTGQTISGVGFQPDLVWAKRRAAIRNHCLVDSVRGTGNLLHSNTTDSEDTTGDSLTAFTSDGFTLGADTVGDINGNTDTYVAWCFKKRAGFFDIQVYSGNGTGNVTINHDLGVEPEFIIAKSRDTATHWGVWHKDLTAASYYLLLNSTAAQNTAANTLQSLPTSTQVVAGSSSIFNDAGTDNMVMYLFASVEGFCKIGSYTGNGNADGTFVYTGFRPTFILVKCSSATSHWRIFDTTRDVSNPVTAGLFASSNVAEEVVVRMDMLSNGFKMRTANEPNTAQTWIYMAIAETPFRYSRAR